MWSSHNLLFTVFFWCKVILCFSYSLCQQHGPASRKERVTHRQQGKSPHCRCFNVLFCRIIGSWNACVCVFFADCDLRMKHVLENFLLTLSVWTLASISRTLDSAGQASRLLQSYWFITFTELSVRLLTTLPYASWKSQSVTQRKDEKYNILHR